MGAALAMASVDLFTLGRDGDPTGRATARLEEALARWRKLDHDWGTAQALNMRGDGAAALVTASTLKPPERPER
jgi:hypothetical protein